MHRSNHFLLLDIISPSGIVLVVGENAILTKNMFARKKGKKNLTSSAI